jgi:hypothetical protein
MFKRIFHNLGVLFSMLAICWIVTGSIIEFHQKYVFHNYLDLVQTHISKSNEKDSRKYFKLLDKNQNFQNGKGFTSDFINNTSEIAVLNLSEKSIFSRYLFDLLTPEYNTQNILRGPPVV